MNVPNLLIEITKQGIIGLEGIFIGKFVDRMESMLNQNGMSINQKQILSDFTVQADHFITARRPDTIFIDKKHHDFQRIDLALPYDTRVYDKEVHKIEKYLNLAWELKNVWNMKVTGVPLVVGALGTLAKAQGKRLKTNGIKTKITELQKTVLMYTSRIL